MKRECLCCGVDGHQSKITDHHVIPLVMEPRANFTIFLCEKCHKRLNSLYVKNPDLTTKQVPGSFDEFKNNYQALRESFNNKKINRGQFGEALWTNLVNYLEELSKQKGK